MKRIEAMERRIANRISAPEPRHDAVSDHGNCGKQIRNHGCPPEAHLTPGQRVAKECGGHHQEQDDDAEPPKQLARSLVRSIVETTKDVDVDDSKEHRGACGVNVSDEPSVAHVAHDVFNGIEGSSSG